MWVFLSILKRDARNSAPFTHHPLCRPFSSPNLSQREKEHGVIFGEQRDRQSQGPNHPGPVLGKSRSQQQPRGLNAKDKAYVRLILIKKKFFFNHSLHSRVLIIRQEEMSLRTRVLSEWKLWLKKNRERAPRGPRQCGKDGEGGQLTFGAVAPLLLPVSTQRPVTATLLPVSPGQLHRNKSPQSRPVSYLMFIHVCCRNYILLTPSFFF